MKYKERKAILEIVRPYLTVGDIKEICSRVGKSETTVRAVLKGDRWDQYGVTEQAREIGVQSMNRVIEVTKNLKSAV